MFFHSCCLGLSGRRCQPRRLFAFFSRPPPALFCPSLPPSRGGREGNFRIAEPGSSAAPVLPPRGLCPQAPQSRLLLRVAVAGMLEGWRPIELPKALSFKGGLTTKTWTLDTKDVITRDGRQIEFVKVDKRAEWLCKTTAGRNAQRGALGRCKIFDELKAKLIDAVAALHSPSSEDEPSQSASDPMDALDSMEAPVKKRRVPYQSKRMKDHVTGVTMPEEEPMAHPGCEATREVLLYASSTNTLWISAEHIPWFVTWVAHEYRSGGVAPVADSLDSLESNCGVPGVHIRWDFAGAWEAVVLEGPTRGSCVTSCVAKLTQEKWAAVAGPGDGGLGDATEERRKQATLEFLEGHMRTVLEQGWAAA